MQEYEKNIGIYKVALIADGMHPVEAEMMADEMAWSEMRK